MTQTHRSAIPQVLAGVYAALNTTGMTALAKVYNHVPTTAALPYVTLGNPTEVRMDAMGAAGKDITFQVHVVSDYPGDYEALTIHSKAVELLHYQSITVSSHLLMICQYETGDTYTEQDEGGPLIRHVVGIYRAQVWQST